MASESRGLAATAMALLASILLLAGGGLTVLGGAGLLKQ
jgi:hypothetical protein